LRIGKKNPINVITNSVAVVREIKSKARKEDLENEKYIRTS
jgi:hypothetical protein